MKGFIICTLLLAGSFTQCFGQEQFEGKVIYLPVESQGISDDAKEQAPMKVVVRAKGNQVRWDEFTEKGSRSIITDIGALEQYVLIEFLGALCAIETPKEQCEITTVEISVGKKHGKMMDQKCLSTSIDEQKIVWIPGVSLKHPFLPNVNGIPIEFWHKTAEGSVLYRAISVIYETQSETFFTVPEGYVKVKADELSSLFDLPSQGR